MITPFKNFVIESLWNTIYEFTVYGRLDNHDLEKYRMESRMGNIKIAHRLAETRRNQSYIARGRIEVKPGKVVVQTYGKPVLVNGTFNVFIRRASLRVSEGLLSSNRIPGKRV